MRARAAVAWIGCAVALSAGCDRGPRVAKVNAETTAPEPETRRVRWPEAVDLTRPMPSSPRRERAWSSARKTRPCHAYFEGFEGKPKIAFPLVEARERAEVLFGCEVEAYEVLEDGARAVAYALPVSGAGLLESPSMRLSVYDEDGGFAWSKVMEREVRGVSFDSSFRAGFIADLTPHLVCGGTSWESGVQVLCAKREGGEEAWSARLPTWSGLTPSASGKSLLISDLLGVKQIYPYNGAERLHAKFKGSGGRSATYALGEDALYFGANRGIPFRLSAYDRETLEERWTVQIDDALEPDYGAVVPGSGVAVVKSGGRLIGVSPKDGSPLWSARIGDVRAPLVASPDAVFVLIRREEGPNRVFELDPKTGKPRGWTKAPDGTLRIGWREGHLLAGSVRTVWSTPSGPR